MAELDYAYLADYAQIEGGKVSALGASYTHAIVPGVPAGWMTSIVGRIRAAQDEEPVTVRVEISPPGGELGMSFESEIPRSADVRPYRGKVGLLFTLTMQLQLSEPGLCTFDIFVNGEPSRRLAFEVEVAGQP